MIEFMGIQVKERISEFGSPRLVKKEDIGTAEIFFVMEYGLNYTSVTLTLKITGQVT